jgi:hypothetical protein
MAPFVTSGSTARLGAVHTAVEQKAKGGDTWSLCESCQAIWLPLRAATACFPEVVLLFRTGLRLS